MKKNDKQKPPAEQNLPGAFLTVDCAWGEFLLNDFRLQPLPAQLSDELLQPLPEGIQGLLEPYQQVAGKGDRKACGGDGAKQCIFHDILLCGVP